jgi:hypothetical protein
MVTNDILTTDNADSIAEAITSAVDTGEIVTVNGQRVIASFEAAPARTYMNGTLSYRVAAKAKGKTRDVFVKLGDPISIDFGNTRHALTPITPSTKSVPVKKAPVEVAVPTAPVETPAAPVETSTAPAGTDTVKAERNPVPATLGQTTGWLKVRTIEGKFTYDVVTDEKQATKFKTGKSFDWEMGKAREAGILIG